MIHTATIEELIWTFIAIAGISVHFLNFVEARQVQNKTEASWFDAGVVLLARQARRHEITMLIVQTLFLLVGVRALVTPAAQARVIGFILVETALIGAAGLMVGMSVLTRRERARYLNKLIREIGNGEEETR